MKRALITGIKGQDGFSLAELLLEKGYEVHGIKKHASLFSYERADVSYQAGCLNNVSFNLHYADLTDATTLTRLMQEIRPDEIYNLGAVSYMSAPFETPEYTVEVNNLCTLRILEAIRSTNLVDSVRIYQAAVPQTSTALQRLAESKSRSQHTSLPYTATKVSCSELIAKHRAANGLYACNGSLLNYEFPRRGETTLIHKIIQGAVRIALGLQGTLYLDSLEARHDWGYSQDYAEAIWRVLQQETPEDYVIATAVMTTVREFVRLAFAELGVDLVFQGDGAGEVGYVAACHNNDFALMPGQTVVAIDSAYYCAHTVEPSLAEASKSRRQLGWKPRHNLPLLVQEMVQHDLRLFSRQTSLIKSGLQALLQPN
ncbi:GDP-mannose 4,6-dehydratase [Hymenobacter sp. BT188]|uniref:GDP-mannose 4,6-dehydratase n=1 Tax=Hymenobacter sp. BT188 TaxID=2763504 RepID=UPI0016515EDD|nr:GDP-mannose 4,6-dehydratase [Hymenobacter sp. BT188]MBC6607467.1 GDP-mannose 4,6-dehydratase [Hymenobacter sp. BT188]